MTVGSVCLHVISIALFDHVISVCTMNIDSRTLLSVLDIATCGSQSTEPIYIWFENREVEHTNMSPGIEVYFFLWQSKCCRGFLRNV